MRFKTEISEITPVILETPYAGQSTIDVETNKHYARQCMHDSLMRGEAPFMSHLLYTQVLDDNKQVERNLGMCAGLAWQRLAEKVVVYRDFGISIGMDIAIQRANKNDIPVEYRRIFGQVKND